MIRTSFDTENGYLLLDSIVMAPINEFQFLKNAKENKIEIESNQTNTSVHTLSTYGELNEFEFGINFTFENSSIKNVWLSWDGGNTKKYGYSTTENQLIADKNSLAKLLAKIFDRAPDEITKTFSAFHFPWGDISASASLQSTIAAIGISWNCENHAIKDKLI